MSGKIRIGKEVKCKQTRKRLLRFPTWGTRRTAVPLIAIGTSGGNTNRRGMTRGFEESKCTCQTPNQGTWSAMKFPSSFFKMLEAVWKMSLWHQNIRISRIDGLKGQNWNYPRKRSRPCGFGRNEGIRWERKVTAIQSTGFNSWFI